MIKHQLQTLSPIDGRYAEKCAALRDLFSEASLVRYRVITEIRWLQFLAQERDITHIKTMPDSMNRALQEIIDDFSLDDAVEVKKIESKINHDVKAVEYFLQNKLSEVPGSTDYISSIHFACTSEDINNVSYAMMIRDGVQVIRSSLEEIGSTFRANSHQWFDSAMLSHTHGQPATPTTMGKEFANFLHRLEQQMGLLEGMHYRAKMNGAVGNFNAHLSAYPDLNWENITKTFVESLGINYATYSTQIEPHDYIAEYFHALNRFNTILIDFCRDIWGYVSLGYFKQRTIEGEIGSSTMPHKVNPIDFENAEGNLGIANAIGDHLASKLPISRWQRDLSDSTVLRNLGVSCAHSLISYASICKGILKLETNEEQMLSDLNNAWEVLAEPIQTVMRRYGVDNPYEKLKSLTRGQKIDAEIIKDFVESLDIPIHAKGDLLQLTPMNYIGDAIKLARNIDN